MTSLEMAPGAPPPDRCGTCRRCIEACPTEALVPTSGGWAVDSRLCISYLTIEVRGTIPEERREGLGGHVFGCDICQDVCPWNRKASRLRPDGQAGRPVPPLSLKRLAGISEAEFREMFGRTAVSRARYSGFLRNVAVAMGNRGLEEFRGPLEKLARCGDAAVEEHARWALGRLDQARMFQPPQIGQR